MHESDTIAAIATAPGEAGIALIRVSGGNAWAIAGAIFRSRHPPTHGKARIGKIEDEKGGTIDEVVCLAFKRPRSFTGEDVVEISCHGGSVVPTAILTELLRVGARLADPGEFAQRAFLNGKLDLTQAEAIMDIVRSRTPRAARAAVAQLEGRIGDATRAIATKLLHAVAHLEAHIDFPEEDIDPEVGEQMVETLSGIRSQISTLLNSALEGRILRNGVSLAICGVPNAGKSSLLNQLIGFERAIVSPTAGTTRDTVEEMISLRGIPFRVMDTAGIRDVDDPVEREGVERAKRAVQTADVVVEVVDASVAQSLRVAPRPPDFFVLNKCDLPIQAHQIPGAIRVSCVTGEGINDLAEALAKMALGGSMTPLDGGAAINARHQGCLARSDAHLEAAIDGLTAGTAPELIAVDLRSALDACSEITGRHDAEDILDTIFGTFCIGK